MKSSEKFRILEDGNKIIIGPARFSLITPHLIRLEYSRDGRFEDRPTIRAINLPKSIKFKELRHEGKFFILEGEHIRVKYLPGDTPFSADNLAVSWNAGNMRGEWKPGGEDFKNLGGIFVGLDHVDKGIIATGVHPASLNNEEKRGEFDLWHTWWDSQSFLARKWGMDVKETQLSLEYIIKYHLKELPEKIKKEIKKRLKFPPGLLSRSGYFVLNESDSAVFETKTKWLDSPPSENYQNWYFFAYGRNYFLGLKNFVSLCGRIPLIPRWAFGSWYSVWKDLCDEDYKKIVEQYHKHKLPLDVLVVDMNWHINGWDGWDWNKANFPEPEEFIRWVHSQNLKVTLNLHCESIPTEDSHFIPFCEGMGIAPDKFKETTYKFNFTQRREAEAFLKTMPEPNERKGIDFFWLDVWQNRTENVGVNEVLWTNHLFHTHMERDLNKRGLILGRYGGIGSHRYPAFFSGDALSQWEVLEHEIDVSARAGNVGVNYLSHDLGGFKRTLPDDDLPLLDPELYIRWMQFGALNPIMRIHSHHGIREPWSYGEKVLEIVRKAYELHISLVPYFYHLSRQAYDEGIPTIGPLYLYYPDDEEAYNHPTEYLIGGRILVTPVCRPGNIRSIYLPRGRFYSLVDGKIYDGPTELNMYVPLEKIPLFIKAGSILPRQKFVERVGTSVPDPLVFDVYPGADDSKNAVHQLNLYEDDGESLKYRSERFSRLPIAFRNEDGKISLSVKPIEGAYRNMPARRSFEIWINFVERPVKVRVDRQGIKEFDDLTTSETGYKYFKETKRLEIKVGRKPVSRPWKVEVDFGIA
ncbi:hypothetical protein CH333_04860 [candidate division WOR-3 bacterium JGI_Cruoil_03_44_89]|uniref:Uncharacterized protein n=1 Tax=candidate division WOR-3 bacterium JGI_Cruoil_03_44_89 TaxID=1973748 RepID=A0A235BTY9_UNCW3|nr:MAG: hypothetical protein CH333_04860 [candidate division WOR-3 bacterium JGI_Cruoil_03_44_89]